MVLDRFYRDIWQLRRKFDIGHTRTLTILILTIVEATQVGTTDGLEEKR